MATRDPINNMRAWFMHFIDLFRTEYEKLSDTEKQFITNAYDYRPPCQIEVFWLSEPIEYQIIVTSHDPDRPDKEIIINGPFKGYEFIDEIEKIMNTSRWKKTIPKESPYIGARTGKIKRLDVFAEIIYDFINSLRYYILSKLKNGYIGGRILDSNSWCWYVKGRVDEYDYSDMVEEIISDIKQGAQTIKYRLESVQTPTQQKPKIKGYATHFYPPIWIGEIPEKTFKQKVFERGYPLPSKILDFDFNGNKLVINSDGFIGVGADSKNEALRILNTIFGMAYMLGVDCLSARESELSEIEMTPESLDISSYTCQISSLRSLLMGGLTHDILSYQRKKVSRDLIEEILKRAEIIARDENLTELLVFLIEGYTHYFNSEYSQSFIVNWLIIERYLYELWEELLKEREIKGKRKNKLTNTAQWGIDYIIEALNFTNKISKEDYKILMEIKNKRNKFVHRGEIIDKSTSKRLLDFTFKIVRSKLSQLFNGGLK